MDWFVWVILGLLIVIVILLNDLSRQIDRLTKIVDMAFTEDQELRGTKKNKEINRDVSVAYDRGSIRNTLHKIESKLDRIAQQKGIF